MGLKDQLVATQKAAQTIIEGAKDRAMTPEEIEDVKAKTAEAIELKGQIEAVDASQKSLADITSFLGGGAESKSDDEPNQEDTPLGERFTKSAAYKAFQEAHPSGLGQGSAVNVGTVRIGSQKDFLENRKAVLGSPVGRVQTLRLPTIDLVNRQRLSLLDLISHGRIGGNFEYVQITGVNRNAAIVPEATSATDNAALKPLSDITTQLADAKVYTYADGYDVTNQLLSDAPAFASYLENELRYSLDNVIEDKILNGTGTNGEPRGILNTTGIQEQEYTGTEPIDLVKAVRRAITLINLQQGGTVQAILMNPEDDENIDLMQDGNERFYGQGPFGTGPQTLWGRPRVISERIPQGTVLLGDFNEVALLDREGLSVQAFNQHADYARRNLVYVRAELRAAQVIWRPARLAVVTKAA